MCPESVGDRDSHRGAAEPPVRRGGLGAAPGGGDGGWGLGQLDPRDCQVFRRLLPGQTPLPGAAQVLLGQGVSGGSEAISSDSDIL